MKHSLLPLGAALVMVAGCGLPQDEGVVMGCFGLVNETIQGQDVFSNVVVTNMFFGGCSPDDVGMQIMERATLTASQDQLALAERCNTDCTARLNAYKGAHPEVDLPLSCQTLFASPCDGLGADVSNVGGSGLAFQAGGPADTRFTLVGTIAITVNGVTTTVPAGGIVDGTLNACPPGTQNCPFTLSRFDVIPADQPFLLNGTQVDKVQVQNQGLISGNRTPSNMSIASNAIEAEVSTSIGGVISAFHVRNSNAVTKTAPNLTLEQFLSTIDVTMTGQGGVSARIVMTGQPFGHRPVAAITSQGTTFECQCKECTTVQFTSAATDEDNDLNSLSWKLDGVPKIGDGTGAPQTLDLQLGVGSHTVTLVATDARGAAAGTSLQFSVVDTTPPVVTPPPNVTLRQCDFPDIGRATVATDVCSPDKIGISSRASGNYPVGTSSVIWTAEDAAGNQGTATQTVTVTNVADSVCCPAGYNRITITQSGVTTNGTNGNDCIIGTSNNDTINGNGGNDYIIGGGGQDTINGGDGNDVILGGSGNDTLNGGNGDDRIAGGPDQDTINGNAGLDIIIGGDGDDTIEGGDGADFIFGNNGQDRLTGGQLNDVIDGGPGDDQINSGVSASTGNLGDDHLTGGFDNDTITDTAGFNVLVGFQGNDRLTGGPGSDVIVGNGGHDICVGGGGIDVITCTP